MKNRFKLTINVAFGVCILLTIIIMWKPIRETHEKNVCEATGDKIYHEGACAEKNNYRHCSCPNLDNLGHKLTYSFVTYNTRSCRMECRYETGDK